MPSTYKLIYFDMAGAGEPVRWMFAHKNVQYEDVRVARDKWPDMKPGAGHLFSLFIKHAGMPFGQLPCLQVDKEPVMAQSGAIYRRVGNDLGMGGSTPQARAVADMIVCSQADVHTAIVPIFQAAEADKPKAKEVAKEKVKAIVAALEKLLIAGGGQWFAGEVGAWVSI